MSDSPTARELVAAVRGFLTDKAMSQLSGHTAFHARVAAKALAIVERELELAAPAQARAHERLKKLLGRDDDLDELTRVLCGEIRAGRMGFDTPGLIDHLRETTLDTLAIDQPTYSGCRAALAMLGRETS
jgi:hypothetical protein